MGDNPVEFWKKQIQWYSDNDNFSEVNRIYGQPMEFEWKIFQDSLQWGILNEIQQMMGKLTRELHRQDHLHVNVQRHCMGCKRKR